MRYAHDVALRFFLRRSQPVENQPVERLIGLLKRPTEMCTALPARGDTPRIAEEPSVLRHRRAGCCAAGCIAKASNVKSHSERVSAGVLVRAVDRDSLIVMRNRISTAHTKESPFVRFGVFRVANDLTLAIGVAFRIEQMERKPRDRRRSALIRDVLHNLGGI